MGGASIKSKSDGSSDIRWEELVVAARTGEKQALAQLVEACQDRLYRFCIHLTSNPTLSEDISQEALIQALQNLDKLREPAAFLSWLFQIARNAFLVHLRKNKGEVPTDTGELPEPESPGPSTDSDEKIWVRDGLNSLDPDDRAILLMIDSEGLSYREVAESLKITENALRSRLHRARQRFIKKING
jgi:RNA polymerase sigma factor (sigma-70 family)